MHTYHLTDKDELPPFPKELIVTSHISKFDEKALGSTCRKDKKLERSVMIRCKTAMQLPDCRKEKGSFKCFPVVYQFYQVTSAISIEDAVSLSRMKVGNCVTRGIANVIYPACAISI